MSHPFLVVSVVGDRIYYISDNTSVVLCGCVRGFHMVVSVVTIFLIKTETKDRTDTTIWKPGLSALKSIIVQGWG